ncbi:hypothetical protein BH24ACI3_BH24ACI3_09630 [soil metagenome]
MNGSETRSKGKNSGRSDNWELTMLETEKLIEKIRRLPYPQQAEVEDFVEFLVEKDDRRFASAAAKASEEAFGKIWDNEEDAVYDKL